MPLEQKWNPLVVSSNERSCLLIRERFPELDADDVTTLLFRPYLTELPRGFFNRSVYAQMLEWLHRTQQAGSVTFRNYFLQKKSSLSQAIFFLRQANSENWHDEAVRGNSDYETLFFIDRSLNPAYLRLIEGVLKPFLEPVAHFVQLESGKGTTGLDIFNIVEVLNKAGYSDFTRGYRNIVRNGIGHGGIAYKQSDIIYTDKKGNLESLSTWEYIDLFDALVDTCNAIDVAYKVFFSGQQDGEDIVPFEILIEKLMENTSSPWWRIDWCVETEASGKSQLLIYANAYTRDREHVIFSALQSAVLAERIFPGYKRYFFSLTDLRGGVGCVAFDGEELEKARTLEGRVIGDYAKALETDGFLYLHSSSTPRFIKRVQLLLAAIKAQIPSAKQELGENFNVLSVVVRDTKIHRQGWRSVVEARVVIPDLETHEGSPTVKRNVRRIIRKAVKAARKSKKADGFTKHLPVGYCQVSVYSRDHRIRKLNSYGLGPDLVCTLKANNIRQIKQLDILGSTIEKHRGVRIAWNKQWLELEQEESI